MTTRKSTWITFDGRVIKFEDMTTDHAINVLIHLTNHDGPKDTIDVVKGILKERGVPEEEFYKPRPGYIPWLSDVKGHGK